MSAKDTYDVVIIGGGPAGLSAAIYTARDRFRSLLLERAIIGGQILNTEQVENYPGFSAGISGEQLTKQMHEQATKYGLETVMADVTGLDLPAKPKIIKTGSGDFTARAVVIASGAERQKLDVPGEDQYVGRGVSFCATCDAAFFPEKTVAVVGGGNAAITEALHLAKFAAKVVIIHRRDQLRATRVVQERAFAEPKISFLWDTVVMEISGGDFVEKLKLRNVKSNEESTMAVDGVFIAVGLVPNTAFLQGAVPLDGRGSVLADAHMATNIPGVFAAGDIRSGSGWQVITAAGDGAMAAMSVAHYLEENA
ncbi:MAG: thioredoxin-disulfide reductase [Chloroflexota bacterium]